MKAARHTTVPPKWFVDRAGESRRCARWAESIAWSTVGLIEAARQGRVEEAVELLNGLGAIDFERGDMKGAERHFRIALEIAARAEREYPAVEAAALVNLGAVANVRGRFDRAAECYRRGRWAYHRAGSAAGEARALNNLGMLFADLKRWRAAARCYRLARRLALRAGDSDLVGLVALNAAEVLIESGELSSARESCDEAVDRLARKDPLAAAEAERLYGQLHRLGGRMSLAREHLDRAARRGRELNAPLTEAESLRELGLLHLGKGGHAAALECFGRSLKLFRGVEAAREFDDLRDQVANLETIIVRIVEQLGREVEAHDPYLYGHSSRVAEYAVAIACDLGFGPDDMRGILVAGYLHDIGKLRIDPAILHKAGRLTHEEMLEIQKHPVLGVERLVRFDLPWNVEAAVRGHHERYDGSGYPDGLAGEEIPLPARILLVADVFDALTTARSYRRPWSREQGLEYLEMNAGTLSDPEVTAVFLDVVRREALGPCDPESAVDEPARERNRLAAAFAALPASPDRERMDEEFARA